MFTIFQTSKFSGPVLQQTNMKLFSSRIIFLLNMIFFLHKNINIFNFSIEQRSLCVPLTLYLTLLIAALFTIIPLHSHQINYKPYFKRGLANVKLKSQNSDVISQSKLMSADGERNKLISPPELLESIFHKVDEDNDELLSIDEVSKYIHFKTQEHIDNAMQENYGLFMTIDTSPRNGLVSWDEYHNYFLKQNSMPDEYIENHEERHAGLDKKLRETISRDKASWFEAAHTDPDYLTLDEFLAFRHPESSHATILSLVEELLDKLDRNDDDILTEDEFAQLKVGEAGEALLSQGEKERREEFRNLVDANGDGEADKKEIVKYIDPKNPRHAREEAITLVTLADTSHDGKLSLAEVLNKIDLFLGSKMVDTARSFHDEF